MIVYLYGVGRKKESENTELPDDLTLDQVAEVLVKFARPYLMSTNVDATWDGKEGTIYAGFHVVGHAKRLEV